jgi:hypothetical protein
MKISSLAIESLILCGLAMVLLIVSLSMRPTTTLAGTQAHTYVVTWSSANVNNDCVASGGFGSWAGSPRSTGGSMTFSPLNPIGSYTFTMRCTGAALSNYPNMPITANAPLTISASSVRIALSTGDTSNPSSNPLYVTPTLSFSSNRTRVNWLPQSRTFTLTWNYSEVDGTCTASGDWSGTKSPRGSDVFGNSNGIEGQDEYMTYRLTCSAPGRGSITRSVAVVMEGPPCDYGCALN